MKLIDTKDAVGHILCHDLTRIVPGEMKDAQFRKGHVVTEADIPMLLSMGKDHLYVWEVDENTLHENEAADRLAALCESAHMRRGDVKEGKIELFATEDGVFQVDVARLDALNAMEDVMVATRHTNTAVKAGDKLCGTRVIPLVIDKRRLEEAEALVGKKPLLKLTPFRKGLKAGIVTTGSEVFYGRIEDKFTPVVERKLAALGVTVAEKRLSDDQSANNRSRHRQRPQGGRGHRALHGRMSVEPDDRTPGAIRESGANIITYGAPVLPGAMFQLGYYDDGIPVMGLPGCVMYAKASIFDIVLRELSRGFRSPAAI
jgi:molybdopterin biosynthesis enzyme